jgi:hypothetical protein
MDTAEIMAVALDQAGLDKVPADSGIHIAGSGLKKALFGVDLEIGELLYARDAGYDVVIAHHPVGDGGASVQFTDVMWLQVEQMTEQGIAEPIARAALAERVATVHRRRHMVNPNRVLDTARLIGLPLMNIHLPPDIVTRRFLNELLAEKIDPGMSIGALLEMLGEIPEVQHSLVKPEVWIGDPDNPIGRATVAIAGGTNGGYPVFSDLLRGRCQDDPGHAHRRGRLPAPEGRGAGGLQLRRDRPHALRLDRDQPADLGRRGPRTGVHPDQRHHQRAAINIGLTAPTR